MKFNTMSGRLLATGAVSAVALGALGAVAPAASAAVATNVYTCGIPNLAGPWDVTVATDVPGLPTTAGAGTDVPANLLNVTNVVTVPKATVDTLKAVQATSMELPDFKMALGTDGVGVLGLRAESTAFIPSADGSTFTVNVNGKNDAFNAPAAGTNTVTAPSAFSIKANKADGTSVSVPCTIKAGTTPAAIASVTTTANDANLTLKAKPAVKAGKDVKVKVKTAADNEVATGKLIATVGGKKVGKATLTNGKAKITIKAKKLVVGKNKIVVSYAGDDYTNKAKAKAKVKVKVS